MQLKVTLEFAQKRVLTVKPRFWKTFFNVKQIA